MVFLVKGVNCVLNHQQIAKKRIFIIGLSIFFVMGQLVAQGTYSDTLFFPFKTDEPAAGTLTEIIQIVQMVPSSAEWQLTWHTDSVGSEMDNQELGAFTGGKCRLSAGKSRHPSRKNNRQKQR